MVSSPRYVEYIRYVLLAFDVFYRDSGELLLFFLAGKCYCSTFCFQPHRRNLFAILVLSPSSLWALLEIFHAPAARDNCLAIFQAERMGR